MTYLALLRAVNVGGHGKVAMGDLRDLLTALGFTNPRSLLVSGNLVFEGKAAKGEAVEASLEEEAARRLGLRTTFFVRTREEWEQVVAGNPFAREAADDPAHLVVLFLKSAPRAADVQALQAAIPGRERIGVDGRHAYAVYPDGIGRSKLTLDLIERKLRVGATGRNWNSVQKLAVMAAAGR